MFEFTNAYIEFLQNFKVVTKPKMPKFDVSAYTDSEYVCAVNSIMQDFNLIDDFSLTINMLKGD